MDTRNKEAYICSEDALRAWSDFKQNIDNTIAVGNRRIALTLQGVTREAGIDAESEHSDVNVIIKVSKEVRPYLMVTHASTLSKLVQQEFVAHCIARAVEITQISKLKWKVSLINSAKLGWCCPTDQQKENFVKRVVPRFQPTFKDLDPCVKGVDKCVHHFTVLMERGLPQSDQIQELHSVARSGDSYLLCCNMLNVVVFKPIIDEYTKEAWHQDAATTIELTKKLGFGSLPADEAPPTVGCVPLPEELRLELNRLVDLEQ